MPEITLSVSLAKLWRWWSHNVSWTLTNLILSNEKISNCKSYILKSASLYNYSVRVGVVRQGLEHAHAERPDQTALPHEAVRATQDRHDRPEEAAGARQVRRRGAFRGSCPRASPPPIGMRTHDHSFCACSICSRYKNYLELIVISFFI